MANLPSRWSRVVILALVPQIDCGRYPIKRVVGEGVTVMADIVADGHDAIAAEVVFGPKGGEVESTRMVSLGNDRYQATFTPLELGTYCYQVRAWIDQFATWLELFTRRVKADSPEAELQSELLEGAALVRAAAGKAKGNDKRALQAYAKAFEAGKTERAFEDELRMLMRRYDPKAGAAESKALEVTVERELARFSAWYEFFPRSTGKDGEHGTFDTALPMLDYVKELGFDVVYLPPIHPIGTTHRKGKDNAPEAAPGEPGSPWAIGGPEGGHKSIHPELGGFEAFERFLARAKELGLELALDLAYQCTPDHPYVKEHPEWFRHRPDGSIRYAENPPKKYQDIYPINFESENWRELWEELKSVIAFWAEKGVRTFRVDNPHTKPLAFWEWCFAELKATYPDLVFLSEAFTRPKLMYALGKVGFSQSYTYFTWRYTPQEFREYLRELFETEVREIYRPNFWPNTPDILPPYLRERPTFISRLVLAATLSASYGIYGPAFELMENEPHPAREEYRNNEKYELKRWDLRAPHSLAPLIAKVNRIRKEQPALHHNWNLRFHEVDNPQLLAYSKRHGDNLVLMVVNFDPHYKQSGFVELPLAELGLKDDEPYRLHDLLTNEMYFWHGARNYVELDPHKLPAHIFEVKPRLRRESDFDYY
jgi:starch synthase (maltosyl-transferring)